MLRGPDKSGLEAELAKVEQNLRRMEADDAFSPAERELEKLYYIQWRNRLELMLANEGAPSKPPGRKTDDAQPSPLNKVRPSDESWKVITPPALLRAVMKIRNDFEQLCDAQCEYFNVKCFKDLHPWPRG